MSDLQFNFGHARRISALILNQAINDYRRGELPAGWFSTEVANTYLTTMGLDPELIVEMANTGELKHRPKATKKKHIRSEIQASSEYLARSYQVSGIKRKKRIRIN